MRQWETERPAFTPSAVLAVGSSQNTPVPPARFPVPLSEGRLISARARAFLEHLLSLRPVSSGWFRPLVIVQRG